MVENGEIQALII